MNKPATGEPLHQEVLELLPWLVNDTLEGRERLKVLNHLSECKDCQLERDRLQQLESLVQTDVPEDEIAGGDYQPSFEKLMAKIDQAEHSAGADHANDEGQSPSHNQSNPRSVLWRYVPAAAAAIVLAGVGLNLLQQPAPMSPHTSPLIAPKDAQTLNIPSADLTSPRLNNEQLMKERLGIYFHENADTETIRSAFVDSGAYIVDGPDPRGLYVVEILLPQSGSPAELLDLVQQLDGVKHVALLE